MLSCRRLSLIAALAVLGAGVSARAQSLGIGDPAPKLVVKSFVKGEPVKEFERGKNYVVEFWATWCGPCRTSIPHLTELQKKHPDVTFIGVSVFEHDSDGVKVKPFVKEMGDKMDYRVAMDSVPEGKDASDGVMARSWMKAAEQGGIPTAFIVNKEGKVAWIGHPLEMDQPLEKVAAGAWDLKTAAAQIREAKEKAREQQAKLQRLGSKLGEAQRSGDPKKLLATVDEIVSEEPRLELQLGLLIRLPALLKLDQQDKALQLAQQLEKSPIGTNPEGLNHLAWTIVNPDSGIKPHAQLVQFALDAARRADDQTRGKNGAIADTLARAYFDSGDVAKAIATQERAIRLVQETGKVPEPQVNQMKDRLQEYQKAAQK